MEKAYGALVRGDAVPVAVAPTGYGKTVASREIYERGLGEGVAAGLVHVAPLRSLVRRIYLDLFAESGGAYQMHDPLGSGRKSPYFLAGLVVTTLDSYLWNLYRLPVLEYVKVVREKGYGHYYPVYTSILSSINVLDEAHLYLGETGESGVVVEAVEALVYFLAGLGAYLLVETATMKPSVLARIAGVARRAGRRASVLLLDCGAGDRYTGAVGEAVEGVGGEVLRVNDATWLWGAKRLKWRTIVRPGWPSAVREAVGLAGEGVVLLVSNTVGRAVELYQKVRGLVGQGVETVLVHGRLSTRDREEAENRLAGMERGVVVATQVVEAGVDVNAIAVFTEPAPFEDMVQRAGRACRRGRSLDYCRENGGLVVIVGEEPPPVYSRREVEESLRLVKGVLNAGGEWGLDWRHPCPRGGGAVPYTELLVELDRATGMGPALSPPRRRRELVREDLLKSYLSSDGLPSGLLELLERTGLCGVARNTVMAAVMVETSRGAEIVVAGLEWVLENNQFLEKEGGAPVIAGIDPASPGRVVVRGPARELWREWSRRRGQRGGACLGLYRALLRDQDRVAESLGERSARLSWVFIARRDAYCEGVGLGVGGLYECPVNPPEP